MSGRKKTRNGQSGTIPETPFHGKENENSHSEDSGETTPASTPHKTYRSRKPYVECVNTTKRPVYTKLQHHSSAANDKRRIDVSEEDLDKVRNKPKTENTRSGDAGNPRLCDRAHSNQGTRNAFVILICTAAAAILSLQMTMMTVQRQEDSEVVKALREICDGCSTKDQFVMCLRDQLKCPACAAQGRTPDAGLAEKKTLPLKEASETFPRMKEKNTGEERLGSHVLLKQWDKHNGTKAEYFTWLHHLERLFLTPDNMTDLLTSVLIGDTGLNKNDDDQSTSVQQIWKHDTEKQLENMNNTFKDIYKNLTAQFLHVHLSTSELGANISQLQTDVKNISQMIQVINMNITYIQNASRQIGSTVSRTSSRMEKIKKTVTDISDSVSQPQTRSMHISGLFDRARLRMFSINSKIGRFIFGSQQCISRLANVERSFTEIKKNISQFNNKGERSFRTLWESKSKLSSFTSTFTNLGVNLVDITKRLRNVEHAFANVEAMRKNLSQLCLAKNNTESWIRKIDSILSDIQLNISQLQSDNVYESRLLDTIHTHMTSKNCTTVQPVCDRFVFSSLLTTLHSRLMDTYSDVRQIKSDYAHTSSALKTMNTRITSIDSVVSMLSIDEEQSKARLVQTDAIISRIKSSVSRLQNDSKRNSRSMKSVQIDISSIRSSLDELHENNERNADTLVDVESSLYGIRFRVSKLDKDSENTSKVLDSFHNGITSLNSTLCQLRENHNSTTSWLVKIEETVEKMRGNVSQLQTDISRTDFAFSSLNTNIVSIRDKVQHLKKHQNNISSWLVSLEGDMRVIKTDVTYIHKYNENISNVLQIVSINTTSINGKLSQLLECCWNSTRWLTKVENVSQQNATNLKNEILIMKVYQFQVKETQEQLISNIATQRFILLILMMVVVLLFAATFRNHKIDRCSTDMPPSYPSRSRYTYSRLHVRDYRLKWTEPPLNAICVISYHSETEIKHTKCTESIFLSSGQPCPDYLLATVHRHTDIEQLPGAKMYLVFVDFNERNVILEDPEKGLGDLRVTTVRSLLKFKGDVTVVYCGDIGSRVLPEEKLFNRNLTSIYSHTELSQLKNQNRMISICERFNEYQKTHLREVASLHFPRYIVSLGHRHKYK